MKKNVLSVFSKENNVVAYFTRWEVGGRGGDRNLGITIYSQVSLKKGEGGR